LRQILVRLFLPLSAILFAGLSFAGQPSISVRYGQITGIEVTTKESAVARNAIIGGVIGVLVDDSFSGALGGATAGFLVTSIIEGDRRVYLYTIIMNDGASVAIAIERPDLAIGHCAALEQDGKHINLRPVSSVHCEKESTEQHEDHRLEIARKCKIARDQLSVGGSSQAIDKALHDMRAYCD
jgi:hypothetical protein